MAGFQTPITIHNAIERIKRNEFLLPAFQREFVWESNQIEKLFDSLMQGYPISSMLFWKVRGDTKTEFRFYQFLKKFIQYHYTHNEIQATNGSNDFHAILDGQQRLTALYIGLCGSYAYKEPRRANALSERSYPTRHLYLNITNISKNGEADVMYKFSFINKEYSKEQDIYLKDGQKWFKAGTVLTLHKEDSLDDFAQEHSLSKEEKSVIRRLEKVIHNEYNINYYEEDGSEPDKAVNIFVRINSGGTNLSFSDILFSIAIASWKTKDARTEINTLVDNVRSIGFNINKDYILKSFLYLYNKDVRFKINSFKNDFIENIENNWTNIRNSILSLFELIKTFGLTDYTLTTYNATLPILYYIYHRNIYNEFSTKIEHANDREAIKKWLYTILVRRTFGGQTDAVLTQSRSAFTSDIELLKIKELNQYPASALNLKIKKFIEVGDDYIEELLLVQKNSQYSFPLLALLYPNLDYKNNNFHQDHLHPEASFKIITEQNKENVDWKVYNSICNLQMLDANENMSKNKNSLKLWLDEVGVDCDLEQFCIRQLIPLGISYDLKDFNIFIEARKSLLLKRFKEILN